MTKRFQNCKPTFGTTDATSLSGNHTDEQHKYELHATRAEGRPNVGSFETHMSLRHGCYRFHTHPHRLRDFLLVMHAQTTGTTLSHFTARAQNNQRSGMASWRQHEAEEAVTSPAARCNFLSQLSPLRRPLHRQPAHNATHSLSKQSGVRQLRRTGCAQRIRAHQVIAFG